MNHKLPACIAILLITTGLITARELRTPLNLRKGPMHLVWPKLPDKKDSWYTHIWTGAFWRRAKSALCSKGCCSQTNPSTSFSRDCCVNQLMFGKASFTPAQTFPDSSIAGGTISVFNGDDTMRALTDDKILAESILTPRIKYSDRGIIIGAETRKYLTQKWRIGSRISVPFRTFKMRCKQPRCPDEEQSQGSSQTGGLTTTDLLRTCYDNVEGNTIRTYAYRLDILSCLPIDCYNYPQTTIPVVNYRNTAGGFNNNITIANNDVTDNPPLAIGDDDRNPITLIRSSNGTPPSDCSLPLANALALPGVNGDGQNIPDGGRGRFINGTDYRDLGKNSDLQKEFWVIPSIDTTNGEAVNVAEVIRDQVQQMINCMPKSAEDFFRLCGICFDPQTNRGIGDIDTELFYQYHLNERVYTEGIVGLRLPSAEKIELPGQLFLMPLGNNGHWEVKFGQLLAWHPCNYFIAHGDIAYSFVLKNTEQVGAPFKGAQTKNIGPKVPASISWGYFIGRIDGQFIIPRTYQLGLNVGYELYHKGKDSVSITACDVRDCFGQNADLDTNLLECTSKATSHKVRLEAYYDNQQAFANLGVGLFFGFSAVAAGSNVPKEREWTLGASLYF